MKSYIYQKQDVPRDLSAAVIAEWYKVHKPEFYEIDRSREAMSPALAATRTYHLRKPNVAPGTITQTTSAQHVLDCIDTPLYDEFPTIRALVDWVGAQRGGWAKIGRVFVTRLAENGNIGRHVDEGTYFDSLHRFHFVLRSDGSTFCWDNANAMLSVGQLWLVNNSIPHWVKNSATPRTHIIFDAV